MPYLDDTYTKPVLDSLSDVHQQTGHGWSRVFRDWIDIVFASLQRDDDSHGKMANRYKSDFGKETTQTAFEDYAEAFASLLAVMEQTDADVLGCLFQEYGAPSEENGQHFTPPHVARLLGGMMLPPTSKSRAQLQTTQSPSATPPAGVVVSLSVQDSNSKNVLNRHTPQYSSDRISTSDVSR